MGSLFFTSYICAPLSQLRLFRLTNPLILPMMGGPQCNDRLITLTTVQKPNRLLVKQNKNEICFEL